VFPFAGSDVSAAGLAFFSLLPTSYGAQNTLVYVENGLFGPAFDGVPTLISPLFGLAGSTATGWTG
jgi:solute:Na+ symporter, SSS family